MWCRAARPPGTSDDGDKIVANSTSAKKRIKQNEKARIRNRARKANLKTETRKLMDAVHSGEVQVARDSLAGVQKSLDQIAAKGTLHRNTAARRKSRLTRQVNAAVKAAESA